MTTAAAEDRERVGPYRVIQAIGAGGSARIDLARIDRAYGFQRHIVIKRPLEHLRNNASVAAQLRREARIGGQLRHPNLVAILDAGIHDGYDYLVLEYVHGAALRALMQTDAPGTVREIPLAVTLAIVSDVARGMHEAHELTDEHGSPLGLVHRDVSPGNILLGLDGTVKLADFGIAKETRVSTLSGSMHGTVTYMAPEQCQGHAFDRRADVFSLGVILYELVTGTRLFWADNDVASLHRVLSGTVPRPRTIKPQIAGALEDIVMTAVAHDAEQRYPTALELAHALERHAADAGEVLGARWIARTMEALVGPRQVPWLATAQVPDVTPRGDGSLVDVIAATEAEEPVPPSFGDAGEEVGVAREKPSEAPGQRPNEGPGEGPVALPRSGSAATVAPTRPITPTPVAPTPPVTPTPPVASARPVASTGPLASTRPLASAGPVARTPRRGRTLKAAIIALAVIGGGTAAAFMVTRSSDPTATSTSPPLPSPTPAVTPAALPAASPVPASAVQPAASTTPPATSTTPPATTTTPPATSTTPPATSTTPPATSATPPATTTTPPAAKAAVPEEPRASPPPAHTTAASPPKAAVKPKHRRPAIRVLPRGTGDPSAGDRPPTATPTSGDAPVASGTGAGSAQPAARPPANVEWKPTLLLPTDGSGAKAPK